MMSNQQRDAFNLGGERNNSTSYICEICGHELVTQETCANDRCTTRSSTIRAPDESERRVSTFSPLASDRVLLSELPQAYLALLRTDALVRTDAPSFASVIGSQTDAFQEEETPTTPEPFAKRRA